MSGEDTRPEEARQPAAEAAAAGATAAPRPERPEVLALRRAREDGSLVRGRVIGWNRGGFHVVIDHLTAFCPRSEMEIGYPRSPKEYLDKEFEFRVLKVQKRGRRVVVSRAEVLKAERTEHRARLRQQLRAGAEVEGTVASLTDFGAFIDLGGIQGLLHVSEISHQRVEKPQDVLAAGQHVRLKVLAIEKGGKRISLSMRALEASPWRDVKQRYPEGKVLKRRVERVTRHGAFIELESGLTGLLPISALALPRGTSLARAYPPGREVTVQVMAVDERRQRVTLAPEGSGPGGTRRDYQTYVRHQSEAPDQGFHALADALKRARTEAK